MPIPANYFDLDGGMNSQATRDVNEGGALMREFGRLVDQIQTPLIDGTRLSTAQKTALRAYYGTVDTGLWARLQAWFQSLPTP